MSNKIKTIIMHEHLYNKFLWLRCLILNIMNDNVLDVYLALLHDAVGN